MSILTTLNYTISNFQLAKCGDTSAELLPFSEDAPLRSISFPTIHCTCDRSQKRAEGKIQLYKMLRMAGGKII